MADTGVLLINTGTADNPSIPALTAYLDEFLHDRMLIDLPPVLWNPILKLFILPRRPKRNQPSYQQMWEGDGFAFTKASRRQRVQVDQALRQTGFEGGNVCVELSMRYGNPSIMAGLEALRAAGARRLVVVPLYPQVARVTTGTCLDKVSACLGEMAPSGWSPQVIAVQGFWEEPAYLDALAASISRSWTPGEHSRLIMSWHSTLRRDIKRGDPYASQIRATAQAVASRLGLASEQWAVGYQSRFDSRMWLEPFTSDLVDKAAREGVADLCVATPGFVTNCLETTIEVGQTLKERYLSAAPDHARYTWVPALDDDAGLARAIAHAVIQAVVSLHVADEA